jgi:hypothetical protein
MHINILIFNRILLFIIYNYYWNLLNYIINVKVFKKIIIIDLFILTNYKLINLIK